MSTLIRSLNRYIQNYAMKCDLIFRASNIVSEKKPHASNSIRFIIGLSIPIFVLAILTVGVCLWRRNILTKHIIVKVIFV